MQNNNENQSEQSASDENNKHLEPTSNSSKEKSDQESPQNTEDNNKSPETNKSETQNSSNERESKYVDGDVLTFVRVRFPGNAKSFPFITGNKKYDYGQKVVAMSDRGMTVGYINSFPYELKFNKSMLPIKGISKLATEEDISSQQENFDNEREAENLCNSLIGKYKLDMTVTHVEFIQFGKKAVFYFNAPARVDFRELVKDLVNQLKMRIELRQISVRDRVAALGAIGPCGLQTCCSSFLKKYGNVSIKMPKNQNLALIPSKINGVCGQIKCCMKYEDEVYTEKRKYLPKEGRFIKTVNGDIGKVLKLYIFDEQFEMLTEKGQRRRYMRTQYDSNNASTPEGWKFPERFNHIVNECSNVIGEKAIDASSLEPVVLTDDPSSKEDNKDRSDKNPRHAKSQDQERKGKRPQHKNRDNRNKNENRSKNDNRNKNDNKAKTESTQDRKPDNRKPNNRFKKNPNQQTKNKTVPSQEGKKEDNKQKKPQNQNGPKPTSSRSKYKKNKNETNEGKDN